MSSRLFRPGSTRRVEHISSPRRARPRAGFAKRGFLVVSCLLLLTSILSAWSFLTPSVLAAPLPSPTQATTTAGSFLQQAQNGKTAQAALAPKVATVDNTPITTKSAAAAPAALPSAEPAKMQAQTYVLDDSFVLNRPATSTSLVAGQKTSTQSVTPSATVNAAATIPVGTAPLQFKGSDGRLEVELPRGSADFALARLASGKTPVGALTLQITQNFGHYQSTNPVLGSYQIQVVDGQGDVVQGVQLRHPMTIIYHYQPSEIRALGLNADQILLSWPDMIKRAKAAKQKTDAFIVPMTNNAVTHTLTVQTTQIGMGALTASGTPEVLSYPSPHMASVQGNSGQLSYSYPLAVPPGTGGNAPQLALSYSSEAQNERHNARTPASSVGDGWSVGMGAITMETYPASSTSGAGTWYFISGIGNVSDRLIPTAQSGFYDTEHISYEKIQYIAANSCFHVWDRSGTYYEFGCTLDSVQYTTDASGNKQYYAWDLNKITAPFDVTGHVKMTFVTYVQDITSTNGYSTVRDAAIKQISYGYGNDPSNFVQNITVAGTIDFQYHGPSDLKGQGDGNGYWVHAYGTNYNCGTPPPSGTTTTLRCDDPVPYGSVQPAAVMSTFELDNVTSYVGTDHNGSSAATRYDLHYYDAFNVVLCSDPFTQVTQYCAGTHQLDSVTPWLFQNGVGRELKPLALGYTSGLKNTYYDASNGRSFGTDVSWLYLNSYIDEQTGVGARINYATAYNNSRGTPYTADGQGNILDDRLDPFYCPNHSADPQTSTQCQGIFSYPNNQAWTTQVVTQMQSLGRDSSALNGAITRYSYWLAPQASGCNPLGAPTGNTNAPQEGKCVGYNWIPGYDGTTTPHPDGDWTDYYHAEFRGFSRVFVTNASGNLTVDQYASTEGWGTPQSDGWNYNAGSLQQADVYKGSSPYAPSNTNLYTLSNQDSSLLQRTVNTYANSLVNGGPPYQNSCDGTLNPTYNPCEIILLATRTTNYEGSGTGNTNAPWTQHDYTYDDYTNAYHGNTGSGLTALTGVYHHLTQEVVSGSNVPTYTKKWQYQPNDQTVNGRTYYTVDAVSHSEIDDSSGHVWQCEDRTYDENNNLGITLPIAGWLTTVNDHSNCSAQNSSIVAHAIGYDAYGNPVAGIDGFAIAHASVYSSAGCAISPAVGPGWWTTGHYTSCTTYDTTQYNALPISQKNALNQSASTNYDYTQGEIPVSSTNSNNQTSSVSYSYPSLGTVVLQAKAPGEAASYTTQSSSISACTASSTLPCDEIDSNSSTYANAVNETFYDSQGRAVETRAMGPDAAHDTVSFTVHNEAANTVFTSQPFLVAHGSGWIDPNNESSIAGSISYADALGRVIATQDAIVGSASEPGISCPNLSGVYSSCVSYGIGSASGDSSSYATTITHDANNHMAVAFTDAFGRTRYTQLYSSGSNIGSNVTTQKSVQYNVLGLATSVTAKDLAPQSGQTITSVTTTSTYDDLGRLLTLNDPDKGTHTYTYDADSRVIQDVSGTRTIGTSYDLLGRVGCVQDAAPTTNGTGYCSGGSHALVQNSYDTTKIGTSGSTDFPVGQLTQTIASTYYADGSSSTVTNQMQYDQRGRAITATMQIGVPSSWNVTTALPTYSKTQAYNDANQPTTTQTQVGGQPGYIFSQAYDSTTGVQTGLSNNSTGVANLATLSFEPLHGLTSDINYQTTTGSALVDDKFTYDGNLRSTGTTATWQSGSGSTGTVFSNLRTFDPVGNVGSVITTHAAVAGQSSSGGSSTQVFCYDEENRLVWAGDSSSAPAAGNGTCGSGTPANTLQGTSYNTNYAYTHLGQTWQSPLNGGTTQQQYLYCDNSHPHQLSGVYTVSSATTCANKGSATASYAPGYDAWGNQTTRSYNGQTAILSFDALDELTQWNAGNTSQGWYAYDNTDSRVLQRSITGSGTTITVYAFGSEEHVYNASGAKLSDTYYYMLGGRLLGQYNGVTTQFYLTDALGSVVSTFDDTVGSAAILGNQAYGPYGKKIYSAGSMGTNKGYTGQYQDATGLDYYNARYYDSVIGRFVSADSVQGNTSGMDPYDYVGGNPETRTDPTGQRYVGGVGTVDYTGPGSAPIAPPLVYGCAATGDCQSTYQISYYINPIIVNMINNTAYNDSMAVANNIAKLLNAGGSQGNKTSAQNQSSPPNSPSCMGSGSATDCFEQTGWARTQMHGDQQINVGGVLVNVPFSTDGPTVGLCTNYLSCALNRSNTDGMGGEGDTTGDSCGGMSFTSTTPVATSQGPQEIGKLKPAEKVWAYNPKTKKMELQPILHVWINHDNDLEDLTIETNVPAKKGHAAQQVYETIHTNKKHPFLTQEYGFLPVANLHVGMHIVKADGSVGEVFAWTLVSGASVMYNLEVQQDHTFTVGDGQWVVHNCGFGSNNDAINMGHILDGHSNGTYQSLLKRAANGDQNAIAILSKDTYFVGQSDGEIGKIVQEAWGNRSKAGAQQINPITGDIRQKWSGIGRGWQVEGWYNITTKTVETAYPVFR